MIAAANAVQYISRLKFFGLPFHAAYPITAAIEGTATKKVKMRNPASTHTPVPECMAPKHSHHEAEHQAGQGPDSLDNRPSRTRPRRN